MAFNLEHFTLTLAIGLLVCLGVILIWNAVFETRGLDLLRPYEPKEALLGVALAVAFVVGFLAEDGFDSVAPDFFDEREAGYWEPLNTNAFANSRFLGPKQLSTYQKIEKYLIPASKEKIRFQSLFGSAVLNNDEPRRRELKWHTFAQYYYEFGLFEKFIPKNDADRNLYDALIFAIRDKRQISLETCYADEKCVCYKIRDGCYSPKVINKYIENFVDQIYYHSKNLIFINKNYFDELTDRERRVNFFTYDYLCVPSVFSIYRRYPICPNDRLGGSQAGDPF